MNITTQSGEDVIEYRHFAAHLKPFDMTDLFDQAVILLNFPMLVVQLLERATPEA